MALEDTPMRLDCGVSLEALVDQVAEHQPAVDPAHQAACEHCQTALLALGETWGELGSLAQQPVRVPPDLSKRIMVRIRTLVTRWSGAAILAGGRGETRVSDSVLAQVARRAALAVPGVALATSLGVLVDPADRSRVRVSMRLAITFGPAIDALTSAVRAGISRQVITQTGVRVSGVDIAVEDLVSDV